MRGRYITRSNDMLESAGDSCELFLLLLKERESRRKEACNALLRGRSVQEKGDVCIIVEKCMGEEWVCY